MSIDVYITYANVRMTYALCQVLDKCASMAVSRKLTGSHPGMHVSKCIGSQEKRIDVVIKLTIGKSVANTLISSDLSVA